MQSKNKISKSEIARAYDMAFSTYSLWEVNRPFLFKFLNYCYVCKINELNLDDEEEQKLIAEFINLPKEEKIKLLESIK